MSDAIVQLTPEGLYCPAGGFHIDPWKPVPRAVITHAHSDHARWGCGHYLAAEPGRHVLRTRLGEDAAIAMLPYGEVLTQNGVRLSLHPAGHVLGSAQVRLEHQGEVWVVTGDYKLAPDPSCQPFEFVRCHTFLTESTFGLPVYRWDSPQTLFGEINDWWQSNREAGKTSILYAYSLGKAQRILASLDSAIGPIYTHGAVENLTQAYRDSGVSLPATTPVGDAGRAKGASWAGALVIAPPSAENSLWTRKFEPASAGVASGWMRIRGTRRRRSVDRGFAISDHADWPGLLTAIRESGATRVLATHGFASELAHYLRDEGWDASVIATRFGDDDEAESGSAREVASPSEASP